MSESSVAHVGRSGGLRPARVLVFNVDDGLFALHIDWIEAMYPLAAVEVHTVRDEEGRPHSFLLHSGEPALILDLRDTFGLAPILGSTTRGEVLVARSPSFLMALPVDSCVGIRELDLEASPPIPCGLVRDGGYPVGHLVALDGKPMAVLDPGHLLESRERDALVPLVQKARAFEERERKSEALWREICEKPSDANLKAYARLCTRNGRAKAAAATRMILRYMGSRPEVDWSGVDGDAGLDDELARIALAEAQVPPRERFIRELVCLAGEKSTGEVIVPQGDGAEESRVYLVSGRVVQAHHRAERGRTAFKQLLATFPEHFYFVETVKEPAEQRIHESTAALLLSTLEVLRRTGGARRPRAAAPAV